jgi:cleavage and polyadenylation specificity factor subunit 2
VGGLPYIYKKLELSCPIYATLPVSNMANISLVDVHTSISRDGPFDLFTLQDIQKTFEKVIPLRYNQNVPLTGTGILIMPYPAGHNLGGAIWRLRKENDDIVYAVYYNHKKEG